MYELPDPNFHFGDDQLNEYLDGELTPAGMSGLEAHMEGCEQCAARLESLGYVFASLAALPDLALEHDLAPEVMRAIRNQDETVWLWPKFRWAFSVQMLATIALILAAWPFAVKWIDNFWRAYQALGAPEWLRTITMASISAWTEGWSATLDRIGLSIQGYWSQGAALWDQIVQPPVGLQIPLFGIVILLVAALALWLAGNGLLLWSGRIQKYPSLSNGGNYD